jgi:Retroviral aspartyl protease
MTPRKQATLIIFRHHRVNLHTVPTESILTLVSRTYKFSVTVGITTVAATTVRAILDTGAGPNLIREEVVPEDWERYRVADAPFFNVLGAGGRRLRQNGVVTFVVQLGNLPTHARFLVVTSLASQFILCCQYIDRWVRTILSKDKRVVLSDDSVIPIIRDSEQHGCARKTCGASSPCYKSPSIPVENAAASRGMSSGEYTVRLLDSASSRPYNGGMHSDYTWPMAWQKFFLCSRSRSDL